MASDLVEKVAKIIHEEEDMHFWEQAHQTLKLERRATARAIVAVVLQAVDNEEASLSYDEDHRVGRSIARKCGIELDA